MILPWRMAIVVLTLTSGAPRVPVSDRADSAGQIESISAQLYYYETGTFSGNVIDTDTVNLWCVITGGGEKNLGPRSRDLFVRVFVRLPDGPAARHSLTLTAFEDGGNVTIFGQSVRLPHSAGEQRLGAPFWIGNLGSGGPMVLVASLRGDGADALVRRVVAFECGE